MSLTAYVRYDNTERIVPGGPIVTSVKPKVGNWIAVDDVLVTTTASNYKLRGFIRYLRNGNYVAGSLILQKDKPKDGNWKEVYVINPACCGATTTYYNVAGCERMEYHVIAYTGVGVLAEGTIVNNATPECWFIIDQATGPEDVGTITYVWDTPSDCQPCINSHTTTTTSSTSTSTTTTTTTAAVYTIGQEALGGIIAYINGGGSTGTSGLVATVADISTGAEWGCFGTDLPGASGVTIGTGNQNTIDIMAGCSDAGIAARLCGDLTQGGYSDWYLPSKDELNALYTNRVAIGNFTNGVYWSSSETSGNNAWLQDFSNGSTAANIKFVTYNVRAIRSF
jgi:hypothetical protein